MKRTIVLMMVLIVLTVGVVGVQADEGNRYVNNPAAIANVFHDNEGIYVWRWNAITEQGTFEFFADYDDMAVSQTLAIATGENVLIMESEDISLWALSTGEYQVNSPRVDGGIDENIFN